MSQEPETNKPMLEAKWVFRKPPNLLSQLSASVGTTTAQNLPEARGKTIESWLQSKRYISKRSDVYEKK